MSNRFRSLSCVAALGIVAVLLTAVPVAAQVSGAVELHEGEGRALVRNPSGGPMLVEIALWESDETGPHVELTRPADANVWPMEFELPPGQTQIVRLQLSDDRYPAGTLLRLVTRMVPPAAEASSTGGRQARLVVATRIISKVHVR